MKMTKLALGLTFTTLISGSALGQVAAPVIDVPPASVTVNVGSEATFSVSATGENLSYRWYFNSIEIPDATNSVLTLVNVQTNNAGEYIVMVSNEGGNAVSDPAILTVTEVVPPEPVEPQTFLDFNNDGKPDLLWIHDSGKMAAWLMDGTNFNSAIVLPYTAPEGWRIAGQADFDKDGKFDFLWQHKNGSLALWMMDGTNRLGTAALPKQPKGGWRVGGLGDFNTDGNTDILWFSGNGTVALWLMDGTNFVSATTLNNGKRLQGGWKVAAVLDVDNDSDSDIVWQHGGGRVAVWHMNGTEVESTQNLRYAQQTSASWKVVSTADFNEDGRGDLVWQHPSGVVAISLMNESGDLFAAPIKKAGIGWKIEGRE